MLDGLLVSYSYDLLSMRMAFFGRPGHDQNANELTALAAIGWMISPLSDVGLPNGTLQSLIPVLSLGSPLAVVITCTISY